MRLDQQGHCPVCREHVDESTLACASCLTSYHRDCWEYNEGCAIFACTRGPGENRPMTPVTAAENLRRTLLSSAAGFLVALIFFWPGLVRIDPLRCRVENGSLRFSWATSRSVECLLEIARDEKFTETISRTITDGAQWHEVSVAVASAEVYYYRVRPLGTEWAREMSRWGWIRMPPLPIEKTTVAGERSPARSHPISLPPGTIDRDFFSSYVFDYDEKSGLMDVLWTTREPVDLCRVVLSRDVTLTGVEKVVDAATATGGLFHKVTLPLSRGNQYRFLVLALPSGGGSPLQSPIQELGPSP